MKYFKAYMITIIVGVIVAVVLALSTKDVGNTLTNAKCREYNDNWTVMNETGESFFERLPSSVRREKKETIWLEKQLPRRIENGSVVAFYMGHNIIRAYIDDQLVYNFDIPDEYVKFSKTPGATWNFINLVPADAGKTLRIELTPVYEHAVGYMPDIVYGDKAKVVVEIVAQKAIPLLISALLFCVGIAIILCMLFFKRELRAPDYVYWLGMFAVIMSVWSFFQTQIAALIYAQNLRGNQVLFIFFQMLMLPLISYVKNFCEVEKSRMYDILCIGSIGTLALTTLLQFTGVLDYRETIWMSYVLYAVSGIWIIVTIKKPLLKKEAKDRRALKIQCISSGALLICIAMDMINYLRTESVDSARLSRIMILIYIVVQIGIVFERSIKLIHLGEQFEVISKEALRDALTKLANRTAFEKDMAKYQAAAESGVVMLDLNNLKYFNDVHGHAMGDYYIIVCSEIIQDIFGMYGKVYRIGGDEFCAVIKGVDEMQFQELRRNMDDRIDALNGTFFENHMSVASGYAGFDEKKDKNIHDTLERADSMMYECKQAMKKMAQ